MPWNDYALIALYKKMSGFSSTNPSRMTSFEKQLWAAAEPRFRSDAIKKSIEKSKSKSKTRAAPIKKRETKSDKVRA